MAKRLLLLALMLFLITGFTVALQADTTSATNVLQMKWILDDWQPDPATKILTLQLSDFTWQIDNDGAAVLQLSGPAPCVGDPDVHEVIKNMTPVSWTDWHVNIQNGTIDAATVRKVNGPSWVVDIANDGSGFSAYTALQSAKIAKGEYLDVWFRYTCTNTGDVVINEYPTTGYIPEPSSLIALLSAVAVLGFGQIKKRI